MTDELRPCPFCGFPADLVHEPMFGSDSLQKEYSIICTNPDCGTGNPDFFSETKDRLVSEWNHRACGNNCGRWIPISEREPETGSEILATDGENMKIGICCRRNVFVFFDEAGRMVCRPRLFIEYGSEVLYRIFFTHWQPKPPFPGKENVT